MMVYTFNLGRRGGGGRNRLLSWGPAWSTEQPQSRLHRETLSQHPSPQKISKTKFKTPYLSINKKQSLKTTKKAARDNDKEQTATEGNGTVTLSTAHLLLD